MKAVVQRVIDARVSVGGVEKGRVGRGLVVYLGAARDDTVQDADWLAEKIVNLRIFDDSHGKMNLSLLEIMVNQANCAVNNTVNHAKNAVNSNENNVVNHKNNQVNGIAAGVLVISQFTLLGDARKGRRPSWEKAAPPEQARELYQYFIKKISEYTPCESGEFQAHMQVQYTNDGPVTILLDTSTVTGT